MTSLSLFTFLHWRRNGNPLQCSCLENPRGKGSLVGCHLCGRTELDTTEATQQQQQHTSKIMLKILQVRLQQYMHHELPEVQAGFRKGRGTRDQIANIHPIIEKGREFQENIYSALLTMPKPLTMWITTNYGKYHTI